MFKIVSKQGISQQIQKYNDTIFFVAIVWVLSFCLDLYSKYIILLKLSDSAVAKLKNTYAQKSYSNARIHAIAKITFAKVKSKLIMFCLCNDCNVLISLD